MRLRMRRVIVAALLASCALYAAWHYYSMEQGSELQGSGDWSPTPDEIVAEISKMGLKRDDTRAIRQFASMFQQRYRDHGLAVGLRMMDNGRLKLMCMPTQPRWDMASLAVKARDDGRQVLGKTFDCDIYETYIFADHKLIGTLRNMNNGKYTSVDFFAAKP